MALAWILYRDLDEVREWDARISARNAGAGCLAARGWEVKQPHAPTVVLLEISVADGSDGPKASMSGARGGGTALGHAAGGQAQSHRDRHDDEPGVA